MKRKAEEGHYICEKGATKIAKKIMAIVDYKSKQLKEQAMIANELRRNITQLEHKIRTQKFHDVSKGRPTCAHDAMDKLNKCKVCDMYGLCTVEGCCDSYICWWCS